MTRIQNNLYKKKVGEAPSKEIITKESVVVWNLQKRGNNHKSRLHDFRQTKGRGRQNRHWRNLSREA